MNELQIQIASQAYADAVREMACVPCSGEELKEKAAHVAQALVDGLRLISATPEIARLELLIKAIKRSQRFA